VTSPKPDANTAASQTVFTYNTNGTVKTIQDPDGNVTNMTYWPSGLVNTVKDANLKITTYTYDPRGNLVSIQDPVNGSTKPTSFTYDAMNRVLTTTYPGATAAITFHYDWRGRRDWVQDQNGNKTTNGYDDADRLISVTDAQSPTPGVTQYTYDTDNHLTDIYDAKQNHTHFTYNQGNTLASTDFPYPPPGVSETYQQNAIPGLLNQKTDRKGQLIVYNYDFQNRLIRKTYPDSTTVQYFYDPAGRMTQMQDPTGTYSFAYDNMNRLTSTTTAYTFLTARNFTVQYTYDAASNRKTMTDPESGPYQYTYDALNRPKTLQDFQTQTYTFGYDNLSRRTSLNRPNNINTTYSYDSQSRLLSLLHKLGSGSGAITRDGATYTYDNAGNRLTRTDKRTNVTLSYTSYDNIYELQTVKQGATTTESYTYDPVGNRLSSLGVSPYTYNSGNWLTSIPGTTYNYDNNGSLTSKSDGTTYNWDYENRLTQVTLPGTGGTVNFKYDPFGRRIQKAFTQGST
jgi:YD repeat-containing protein